MQLMSTLMLKAENAQKDDCVVKVMMPDSGNLRSFPGFAVSPALCTSFHLFACLPPSSPYHRGIIMLQFVLRINTLMWLVHLSSGKILYKSFSTFLFFKKVLSGADAPEFSCPVSRKVRKHLQRISWYL